MAAGDAVVAHSSIEDDAYLAVQPGAGVEWSITNIFYPDAVTLEWYDGTNSIVFETTDAGVAGVFAKFAFPCTNAKYLRVRNISGDTDYLGYSGWVTKEA